jgi:hypothetical protein
MILRYFVCPNTPQTLIGVVKAALSQFHNEIQESELVTKSDIIICQPSEFLRYRFLTRENDNVDIVTPLWVFYSCAKNKLLPFWMYSADPRLIFSGLLFNTQHLDVCSMTNMYKDVIVFFGGRISDGQTDVATHTIMEIKPYNSRCRPVATTVTSEVLASTPLSSDSLSLFVDAFFQLSTKSIRQSKTHCKENENITVNYAATHTVSYSWLDDCISQKVKLPESEYYTTPMNMSDQQSSFKTEEKRIPDLEFQSRNNESLPLKGVSASVSKQVSKKLRQVKMLLHICRLITTSLTMSSAISAAVLSQQNRHVVIPLKYHFFSFLFISFHS